MLEAGSEGSHSELGVSTSDPALSGKHVSLAWLLFTARDCHALHNMSSLPPKHLQGPGLTLSSGTFFDVCVPLSYSGGMAQEARQCSCSMTSNCWNSSVLSNEPFPELAPDYVTPKYGGRCRKFLLWLCLSMQKESLLEQNPR